MTTEPVAALRNEYTRDGRVRVPALTTLLIIEATNACWRFIRPMSALGVEERSRT